MESRRNQERISRLRQERHYLEHKCSKVGEMLKGSYINRFKPAGEKAFKSVPQKETGVLPGEGKLYGYITYLKEGVTRHKYVRKQNEAEAMDLCWKYQEWSVKMARIREINRLIVVLLDEIAKTKTQEVEKYVRKKRIVRRVGKTKGAK